MGYGNPNGAQSIFPISGHHVWWFIPTTCINCPGWRGAAASGRCGQGTTPGPASSAAKILKNLVGAYLSMFLHICIYIYNYIHIYTQLYIYIYVHVCYMCNIRIYDVTRCHFHSSCLGHKSKVMVPNPNRTITTPFDIHLNLSGAVGPTDRRNQGWEESDWVQVQGKLYWNTV